MCDQIHLLYFFMFMIENHNYSFIIIIENRVTETSCYHLSRFGLLIVYNSIMQQIRSYYINYNKVPNLIYVH